MINLYSSIISLLMAFLLGGIIGFERQILGRAAGLRTHILVSLGSAVAVLAGVQAEQFSSFISVDTGRIISGLITGVGFLGAGTIIRYREGVGGLTTAACIWFVATIGILCGLSFFKLAAVATFLGLVVLILLDVLEDKMPSSTYWMLSISSSNSGISDFEKKCRSILQKRKIHIKSATFNCTQISSEIRFVLKLKRRKTDFLLAEELLKLDTVTDVKWSHRAGSW